jgi:hypothetical protein
MQSLGNIFDCDVAVLFDDGFATPWSLTAAHLPRKRSGGLPGGQHNRASVRRRGAVDHSLRVHWAQSRPDGRTIGSGAGLLNHHLRFILACGLRREGGRSESEGEKENGGTVHRKSP